MDRINKSRTNSVTAERSLRSVAVSATYMEIASTMKPSRNDIPLCEV